MNSLTRSSPLSSSIARGPVHDYSLALPQGLQQRLARAWLWLGLLALIGSGLFSVLLVVSRTPGVNQWLPVADFFRVALVVHVDLSVLVWFIAMAGLLWSLIGVPGGRVSDAYAAGGRVSDAYAAGSRVSDAYAAGSRVSDAYAAGGRVSDAYAAGGRVSGWAAPLLCAAGAALMSIAPFVDSGEPIMANYIPVLAGPVFLAGLAVFALGTGVLVLRSLWRAPKLGLRFDGGGALHFGLNASVVATAVALLAFAASLWQVPTQLAGKAYYEILFWGGGHALQFTWTLLMLVAWLWLASACGAPLRLSPRLALAMFGLALVAAFVTPYAYLAHDIASVEHRNLLTWAMRAGGGPAIVPIGLAVLLALHQAPAHSRTAATRPLRAALVASLVLFGAGGLIGVFIQGSNVRIPAHYHGCIVGVTLALMGLVYHLLPRLGYGMADSRWAAWQPTLYGAGQLMHIVGLVWSGGYGVQRKVAGSEQVLRSGAEIAGMGLMGLGGLIAIAGGVLFVVVVVGAMRRAPQQPSVRPAERA
jgi:hypothetical protein